MRLREVACNLRITKYFNVYIYYVRIMQIREVD